jgi:hypothetical protein
MTELTVLLLLVALGIWLAAPGRAQRRREEEIESVEADELEAAEREVRELDLRQDPGEGWIGDDWGPGAGGGSGSR